MMQHIGEIYRDGRDIYLVIRADNEAYYFEPGRFHQGLTRFASKGCKITEIEDLMMEAETEEPEMADDEPK